MREFFINLIEGYSTEYEGGRIIKTPIRDAPRRPPTRKSRVLTTMLLPLLVPVYLIVRSWVPPERRDMGRSVSTRA